MTKKKEEWKVTLSLFNNLENGGIKRENLNAWKKSCFQETRPTILLNYPEKNISCYFRNVNQAILHQS